MHVYDLIYHITVHTFVFNQVTAGMVSFMLSQHSNKALVYNGGISKIRIDNSVVPML